MKLKEAERGMRVIYVPAGEQGIISSVSGTFIFVKFEDSIARLGFEGTTAKACYPRDIEKEGSLK